MKRFLTLIVALAAAFSAQGANLFVTPSGAGSHNGSSWNQAFAGTGGINWSAVQPGDTIWLAGGSYGAFWWGASGTSTQPISFKRAVASAPACTGSPGWNNAFDSQVVITSPISSGGGLGAINVAGPGQNGVVIDGVVADGLKFSVPPDPAYNYNLVSTPSHCGVAGGGNYWTFRNLLFEGPGTAFSTYGILWGDYNKFGGYCTNLTVRACRFEGMNTSLFLNFINGILWEHCETHNQVGNGLNHDDSGFINNCDWGVMRYNYFHEFTSLSIWFSSLFPPGSDHWKIYGNLWYNTYPTGTAIAWDNGNGTGVGPYQLGGDWQFYNNTIAHVTIGLRTDSSRFPGIPYALSGGSSFNNLFYSTSFIPGPMSHDYNWINAGMYGSVEAHGIQSSANPFVNYPTSLAIVTNIASDLPRGKGTALASEFQTSYNGLNWSAGDWDMGAYKATSGGLPVTPGSITLSAATASAVEGNSITITAMRTGGSSGAVGCSYSTADGTAVSGVNYTSASGSFSWAAGDAANKTVTITTANVGFIGTKAFSFGISAPTGGATLGAITSDAITLTGTGTPVLTGLSWEAEAGVYAAPWALATAGGVTYIYSTVETDPNTTSGLARYPFTAPSNGVVRVKMVTSSETGGNNSVFIGMNDPSPTNVWDMPVTGLGVWTNSYVSWRGPNGTPYVAEFPGKTWSINAGANELDVMTREAASKLDSITIEYATNPVVNVTVQGVQSVLAPSGFFPAGSNVTITIYFSAPATVTSGTPTLTLNNGKTASYTSGSGGTNLVFVYTTAVGDDTQSLSYAATNSLAGDIRDGGGNAFNLTMPAPGAVGSMTYNAAVVVDTVSPAISAGPPTLPFLVNSNQSTAWAVTYSDLNFGRVTIGVSNVTLHTSGTAAGLLTVQPFIPSNNIAVITVYGVTGTGTLQPVIAFGTGADMAGNLASGLTLGPVSVLPYKVKISNMKLYNVLFP